MLKRYQRPKSEPSTNVSLNLDLEASSSALSEIESAALTCCRLSDWRSFEGSGVEIQPLSLGEEEHEKEGKRREDEEEVVRGLKETDLEMRGLNL